MYHIRLLCVGKLKEPFWTDAASEYEKRLTPFCRLSVEELPEQPLPERPSAAQLAEAMRLEADALYRRVQKGDAVFALCSEGKQYSSEAFASVIERLPGTGGSRLAFLIGGSNGLHASAKARASQLLSLSEMTFPHHLARVILLEQIYRAFQIMRGTRYHK